MLQVLKVSQLNRYVRSQLESDPRLREVYVAGEIGTLSANQRSGHLYFTLRDGDCSVRAVMFASNAQYLKFMPRQGLCVIARGSVTLYERDGAFQIVVSELMLDGAGALGFAFERQKQLLEPKGYFNEAHKRPIPQMAQTIGVVTSPSGAALHDIITTVERLNPTVRLILSPASVQGAAAPAEIAAAISALNKKAACDVIIVGRGGGSAEDLWCFNEEAVVKAVFESKTPIISAVGHETDITLCDLAADMRAATPTAAAQLAVCDKERLLGMLAARKNAMDIHMNAKLINSRRMLDEKKSAPQLKSAEFFIDKNRQRLNNLISSMYNLTLDKVESSARELSLKAALLESLSPLKVLARGYAIALKNGRAVTAPQQLEIDDTVRLRFASGSAEARITKLEKEKNDDL